jgi:hypothetical protein
LASTGSSGPRSAGLMSPSAGAGADRCANIRAAVVSRGNGTSPVNAWNSTQASEY